MVQAILSRSLLFADSITRGMKAWLLGTPGPPEVPVQLALHIGFSLDNAEASTGGMMHTMSLRRISDVVCTSCADNRACSNGKAQIAKVVGLDVS